MKNFLRSSDVGIVERLINEALYFDRRRLCEFSIERISPCNGPRDVGKNLGQTSYKRAYATRH